MLTLYRRHRKACPHRDDRYWKKCRCAMWCQGTVGGNLRRQALKTTSWERAETLRREIEGGATPAAEAVKMPEALKAFMTDCEARKLSKSSLTKYKRLSHRLEAYWGKRAVSDFTHTHAVEFRSQWKLSPITSGKELERMKTVFGFFVQNGWINKSPVAQLRPPVVRQSPTLPFNDDEVAGIIKHCDPRSSVFSRVLLHSGLRIIDAAKLTPDRVTGDALFLYQQKTGVPVRVPLPPDLVKDLGKLKLVAGKYFVTQSERPEAIAENYRLKLNRAAKKAKVSNAHPHRWRDTFAVRLLEKGVPIETVSILLGHTNIRTTQKSYAPWVQSLQRNLESAVRKTWA